MARRVQGDSTNAVEFAEYATTDGHIPAYKRRADFQSGPMK
jgi:hypothetical protein